MELLLVSSRSAVLLSRLALVLVLSSACSRVSGTDDGNIDALPRLFLEEQRRIGDVNDPDIGFSRVAGVDVDRDGNVFVVEGAVPEIRVYGPDGVLARRLGGRGSGPGEFREPPRIGIHGDTVWTVEAGEVEVRLALFDRRGRVLSTGRTQGVRVSLPASQGFVRPRFMRSDGLFTSHLDMVGSSRNDPSSGVNPGDSIPVPHVLFDATGQVTDTIGWAPRPPPRMWSPPIQSPTRQTSIEVGGRRYHTPYAPGAVPWWEPLRDGYVVVESPLASSEREGSISVMRFDLVGDTVFTTTLRYRPERWTSEELDSIAVRASRFEPGGMAPYIPARDGGPPPAPDDWPAVARRLRDAMDFPEFKLPIQTVWVGGDESVWLLRTGAQGAPLQWIVLDARGRPEGMMQLPRGVRVLWRNQDLVWASALDENDVPWLVCYRIRTQ